jgi:hypothetical protein
MCSLRDLEDFLHTRGVRGRVFDHIVNVGVAKADAGVIPAREIAQVFAGHEDLLQQFHQTSVTRASV